jgi:catechol 2,3-dioxygenase-like lactoylglutathione lyase family enzyme
MISIRDIDHIVLRVTALDRALTFYCDVLGCTLEKRDDDIGLIQLRAGRSLIDLVPIGGALGRQGGAAAGRDGRNVDHFCVRIEPFDGPAVLSWLASHGVAGGAIEQRNGAEGVGPSIYVVDPDGNTVELKGPPDR